MIKKLFKSSLMILFLMIGLSGKSFAQELKFFTIGTAGTAYTYYPVGGMIANAISKPPGSREWKVGLLIEYRKWEKIATIMYKNKLVRVSARDVQKFGKRYFEK